ncbi:Hypothetical_protein [Hexamita inflata]|uniref:Hypothetical_protein n=1 Tax=Hexamita inflata TaxID=28002 RepID=A0AA86TI34_9EUKA|nr:Hypothetical protein HINF_LOCUS4172 [Hexamita inflata]CAI9960334.1 Hypothetical protein HINF_LOCUS47979 [Hexamita inflata]
MKMTSQYFEIKHLENPHLKIRKLGRIQSRPRLLYKVINTDWSITQVRMSQILANLITTFAKGWFYTISYFAKNLVGELLLSGNIFLRANDLPVFGINVPRHEHLLEVVQTLKINWMILSHNQLELVEQR